MLRVIAIMGFVGASSGHFSDSKELSRVGSLIEKRLGTSSPELRSLLSRAIAAPNADMQGIFDKLKQTIESDVEARIIADHQDAQAAITAAVKLANGTTVRTGAAKAAADLGNKYWAACIDQEKKKIVEHEEENAKLPGLKTTMDEACQKQASLALFESKPQATTFNCDFSNGKVCASELQAYKQSLDSIVSSVQQGAGQAVSKYVEAKSQCQAATQAYNAQVAHVGEVHRQWASQRKTCHGKRVTRETQICTFGTFLQEKCVALSNYKNIIASIDGTGSEFSHPDRVAEWRVSQLVKCLVGKFASGAEIVEEDLSSCEKAVNFDNDVGVLDKKADQIAQYSATFGCNADSEVISFAGGTWEVPQGTGGNIPPSQGYKFNPEFKVQASLGFGTDPFPFC